MGSWDFYPDLQNGYIQLENGYTYGFNFYPRVDKFGESEIRFEFWDEDNKEVEPEYIWDNFDFMEGIEESIMDFLYA